MKKLLLSLLIASSSFVSAQVLQSDDFEGLNLGDVGTNLTGVTPGQGGWFTANAAGGTNGSNSNYQIISLDGDPNGQSLQLTGSNAATGTRFMWKDGLIDSWAGRTQDNDIIEVEFDFNPLGASTSLNGFRVYIYSDDTPALVLAGIGIASNAVVNSVNYSNMVQGFGHWTSTPGTGTYSFGLGATAATQIVLTENTWVRLGFSFNTVTGEIKWKGPDFNVTFNGNVNFPVITAGKQPGEMDFVVAAGTGNVVADEALFDNFVMRASSTDTLLGTDEVVSRANAFSVYPNPANDFVKVSSYDYSINKVEMTDINGRVVKTISNNSNEIQIDFSDLSQGVYVMRITSSEGVSATKKIVKQ